MTSKQIGIVGELAVAQDLVRQGYSVFTQFGENSKVDIVAIKGKEVIRIQVKSARETHSGVIAFSTFKMNSQGGYSYTSDDCDVFAVYNHTSNVVCYIGWSELEKFDNFFLRFRPAKNNQKSKVRLASDFQSIESAYQSTKDFHASIAQLVEH